MGPRASTAPSGARFVREGGRDRGIRSARIFRGRVGAEFPDCTTSRGEDDSDDAMRVLPLHSRIACYKSIRPTRATKTDLLSRRDARVNLAGRYII